jgi:hypothetical protein
VWGISSIVWTDPDSRQRNLLIGQKIDFDIAVAGSARPAVGARLTPRAIWRVVGLQYWGVYNPVPLFQHLCHLGWETSFSPGSGVWASRRTPGKKDSTVYSTQQKHIFVLRPPKGGAAGVYVMWENLLQLLLFLQILLHYSGRGSRSCLRCSQCIITIKAFDRKAHINL